MSVTALHPVSRGIALLWGVLDTFWIHRFLDMRHRPREGNRLNGLYYLFGAKMGIPAIPHSISERVFLRYQYLDIVTASKTPSETRLWTPIFSQKQKSPRRNPGVPREGKEGTQPFTSSILHGFSLLFPPAGQPALQGWPNLSPAVGAAQ